MRRYILGILSVGALLSSSLGGASAQDSLPTGEEVLAKYVEVTGGKEAYAKIKSQEIVAKISIPEASIEGDMKVQFKKGQGLLATIEIAQLGTTRRGLSGEVGWESSQLQGPRLLSKPETTEMLRGADPEAPVNWKKYFKSAKNEGIEEMDGEDCYKIVLTSNEGKLQTDYYSVESGLLIATRTKQETQLGEIEITSHQSDYREVDGLKQPFKSKQDLPNGISQVIEMSKVTLNADIEDSVFELPEEIKKLQK